MVCKPPAGLHKRGFLPAPPLSVNEVGVVLTGDTEVHRLNRDYRGKDKTTDVLSFPQLEGEDFFPGEVPVSLGDIIISLDKTLIQAREYQVTPKQELLRLMIHGLLHLLGYDHEKVSKSEAARMRRIEQVLYLRHLKNCTHL